MNITLRQMTALLALERHGSMTAAARACHVTQPTVSMQMKELSEAVGLPLYEQIGKRLHLTEAGIAVADAARTVEEEWARLQQTIDAMKGHRRGRLRISVVSTAKYFVPRVLGGFCGAYPDIDVSLQVLNRDGVVQRLRQNLDDLYVMSIPPADMALEKRAFLDNPLVLIAPRSHSLAGKRGVDYPSLSDQRFVLREPGSGTRLACDSHFAKHRFKPSIRLELGSNEAIKQAVAAGLGLGVVSTHALAAEPADEGLAVLRAATFPIEANWWVLYPRGKRLSPIATEFVAHLESAAGASRPATRLRSGPESAGPRSRRLRKTAGLQTKA
jgi:DNA-binding transcriptional LysR family regulator